jgi:hypothetical protein
MVRSCRKPSFAPLAGMAGKSKGPSNSFQFPMPREWPLPGKVMGGLKVGDEGGCRKAALRGSIGGSCQIRTFAPIQRIGDTWSTAAVASWGQSFHSASIAE